MCLDAPPISYIKILAVSPASLGFSFFSYTWRVQEGCSGSRAGAGSWRTLKVSNEHSKAGSVCKALLSSLCALLRAGEGMEGPPLSATITDTPEPWERKSRAQRKRAHCPPCDRDTVEFCAWSQDQVILNTFLGVCPGGKDWKGSCELSLEARKESAFMECEGRVANFSGNVQKQVFIFLRHRSSDSSGMS